MSVNQKNEVIIVKDNPIIREIIDIIYNNNSNAVFQYIGSGLYGDVLTYKGYAIKIFYFEDDQSRDYEVLLELQDCPNFPSLYAYKPDSYMIVSEVYGTPLHQYEGEVDSKMLRKILEKAEDKGFIINDITDFNIIVDELGNLVIVDVGDFIKFKYGEKVYYSSATKRMLL